MQQKTMSVTRKISQFRQLSLNCELPSPQQKRQTLKKQFSEDIPDFTNSWLDPANEIRVAFNTKIKKNEKVPNLPQPFKIAWDNKSNIREEGFGLNEDTVIIKKFKEVRRLPSGRLTRHGSLEKDSILNSKQDITERLNLLKNPNTEKENEKTENKPNLQIFLAHNTHDFNEGFQMNCFDSQSLSYNEQFVENVPPKILQPLVTNVRQDKAFQIRKSTDKKPLESPKVVNISQNRPNFSRSNTIVVVPLVEKDTEDDASNDMDTKLPRNDDNSGINVIIRPVTAQSRREKFQKRTNSAFHGPSKEQPLNFRPPLVRSSSAPSTKPEKSKFLASKRKIKSSKRNHNSPKDEDRSSKNVDAKEWKNAAPNTSEIVTMVSLLSPSGSDNEDCSEYEVKEVKEVKERPKSVLKKESPVVAKNTDPVKEEERKEPATNVSLRKMVKSVSFQQSSIHAIRSFSASFPARRGSMATTLGLGNKTSNIEAAKKASGVPKAQEKRGTNPSSPDANERVPKRRLVRSYTEESKSGSSLLGTPQKKNSPEKKESESNPTITIDLHTKPGNDKTEETFTETSMKLNLEENVILLTPEIKKEKVPMDNEIKISEPTCDTPKEKQCWAMYCKMTEKGINVSYDTILRGMLTPTEYRMRRKTSIAEEMNLLVNPPSSENTLETKENTKEKTNVE